jgi:DNA-binding MarR family transcriptional regulator
VTDASVIGALAPRPGLTSAQLADVIGSGRSTAAKRLAALEAAGSVRRQPGGRVDGARLPDRWWAVAPPGNERPVPGPGAGGVPGVPVGAGQEPAGSEAVVPSGRLGRGELGALVRAYLAARPGEDLGPAQVGKALGRSQGAVSNALARLEAAGEARLVSASPRRYRAAAGR